MSLIFSFKYAYLFYKGLGCKIEHSLPHVSSQDQNPEKQHLVQPSETYRANTCFCLVFDMMIHDWKTLLIYFNGFIICLPCCVCPIVLIHNVPESFAVESVSVIYICLCKSLCETKVID